MNYKDTLNLPNTKFPMRANLTKLEPNMLKYWQKQDLYKSLRNAKHGKKIFILHDGPPYANGNIHIGHAVNKILKDIVLKFKGLMGYDTPYVPGWDCHGLPIELKVEHMIGKPNKKISAAHFRSVCRTYAMQQIIKQKKEFIRLGVLGDWDNPYTTMDFTIEANIIRMLGKIIHYEYLYQGTKPVYWCIDCCSALAETEIEYYDICTVATDVAFIAKDVSCIASKFNQLNFSGSISLLIWTTNPWTLPANCAIAIHPNFYYRLIIVEDRGFILASHLVKNVMQRIGVSNWTLLGEIKGNALELLLFHHPFMNFTIPVVLSNHITNDTGTGIVHIAPNHGHEDYIIGQKYKLKSVNVIDEHGYYVNNILSELNGIQVFQANKIIITLLKKFNALIHINEITHKYPHCWRHKTPIIFRTTSQWFINMDKNNLREKSLVSIENVQWIPDWSKELIKKMIINRPDWCVSRQRTWGIPITIFLHKKTNKLHPHTTELIKSIAKLVEQHGIQAWWDLDITDILGQESIYYKKVSDTLDVWFDSGSTYYSVLSVRSELSEQVSDLYLEGLDQHRGWFLSSLILSIATQNQAPYKQVITHGFTVDDHGRKMSKSLGNVISPQQIIDTLGADILRLWVASNNYTKEISLSHEILQRTIDIYRRIRNTARFLLANLNNFHPVQHLISPNNMIALDRWIVSRTYVIQKKIIFAYDHYDFYNVVQYIMQFCSIELGSFYLDLVKDRQYTNKLESLACRSCQTAFYHIIESIVRWIAPIISFTADEIWKFIPGERKKFVFTEEWYDKLFVIDDNEFMNNEFWHNLLQVRYEVNQLVEQSRINNYVGSSLETSVKIYAEPTLAKQLRALDNELCFALLTSHAKVMKNDENITYIPLKHTKKRLKIILEKAKGKKCQRCWHVNQNVGCNINYPDICTRCIKNVFGTGENRKFI